MCPEDVLAATLANLRFADLPVSRSFVGFSPAAFRSLARAEGTSTQTVICSKERFSSVEDARGWCKAQGFRTDKVDVTGDSYRFRQFDPGDCAEGALGNGETFATIELTKGVKAVICKKSAARSPEEPVEEFPDVNGIRYADIPVTAKAAAETDLEKLRGWKSDRAAGDEKKLYEVAISSESEIERWFGLEVLGHGAGEVDSTRMAQGAAVLVDHGGDQVGVVEPGTFRVDPDKVSRAYVRFSGSQRGQDVQADVEQQIRRNISVGYFIKDAILSEVRTIGKDAKGNAITVDVWRVTRWTPAEVSLVSVPADVSVGVGRSAGAVPEAMGAKPVVVEEPHMKKKVRDDRGSVVEVDENDPRPAIDPVKEREASVNECLELCELHQVPMAQARAWISEGLDARAIGLKILDSKRTTSQAQPAAEVVGAMPAKDRRRYSYTRAILGAANQREGIGKFDGLEAEVHAEIDRKLDSAIKRRGGIFVPYDLRSFDERMQAWEKRTLDSKTLTKGSEVVFEQPGELIEILRQTSVAIALGARTLGGLTGPVAFPKHTGRLTAYWVGENPGADVASSDIALGLVNMAPKTIQATSAYSRQLLVQASIDVEAMVRSEMGEEHSLLLDRTVFHGEGAGGEPTGIYKAPDVNSRAVGGAPDLADVVTTVKEVLVDNALRGTLGWVMTPTLAAELRSTLEFAAAGARPLWLGPLTEGDVLGYRALSSNQLSSTMTGSEDTGGTEQGAIFGNWAEVIIGLFAGLELIVDPYAQKRKGVIEVTSFQMADLVLRHGESFCKWTGAT